MPSDRDDRTMGRPTGA